MLLFFFVIYKQFSVEIDIRLAALAAVTWYGVHPAMAETVNYIIQRGDIFSTFGVVMALALYAVLPRLRRWGLYLVPFVFGLLSKPPAIVFPVLLFAYIAYFEEKERSRWKVAAIATIPAAVTGVALMWFQSVMTPKSFTPSASSNADYLLTQPFVLLRYFGEFFLPIHLSVDTDLQPFHQLNVRVLYGFVFLAVLIFAIFLTFRKPVLRPISYGLLWFFVASLPTSVYRLAEVENDHRMYMPFVGLALAVTWSLALFVNYLVSNKQQPRRIRQIAACAVCALLTAYAYGAHLRNQVWHTEESLWLDCVQKSPKNGRGLMNYGLSQMSKGNYPVALDYFQRALLYTPNYPVLEINLGVVNAEMNRPQEAEQHFRRAILLAPSDDSTHFYYGRWLYLSGRIQEALSQLETSVQLNPDRIVASDLLIQAASLAGDLPEVQKVAAETLSRFPTDEIARRYLARPLPTSPDGWIDISLARYRNQDYAGCISAAKEALKIEPHSALAYNNIGAAYAAMGQWQIAIETEKQALAFRPDFEVAKNNLALYTQKLTTATHTTETPENLLNKSLALNQVGKYQESIEAAQAALKLRPNYAEAWNNIAAGYESMGRWDDAVAAAKEAIRLKPDFQLAKNNLAWSLAQKKQQAGH
jgi:tetratricopeptide (TPR) repeat protein